MIDAEDAQGVRTEEGVIAGDDDVDAKEHEYPGDEEPGEVHDEDAEEKLEDTPVEVELREDHAPPREGVGKGHRAEDGEDPSDGERQSHAGVRRVHEDDDPQGERGYPQDDRTEL